MRREAVCLLLVLLAVAAVSAWQHSEARKAEVLAARQTIQAHYDVADVAFARQDINGFLQFCTEDFSTTSVAGKAYELDAIRRVWKQAFETGTPSISYSARILSFELQSQGTRARVVNAVDYTIKEPKGSRFISYIIEDIWISLHGQWQLKSAHELSRTPVDN